MTLTARRLRPISMLILGVACATTLRAAATDITETMAQMRSVRQITPSTSGSVSATAYCPRPGSGSVTLHFITPRNGRR